MEPKEFANHVLESLNLTDMLKEDNDKVDSETIKDKIKFCNNNIYTKNKDKILNASNTLKDVAEMAKVTLQDVENHKKFDSKTLLRDSNQIDKNVIAIGRIAVEIKNLQQRLESLYEDTAFKLNKYFDI